MFWILVVLCVFTIGSCHWLAGLISNRPDAEQARWASVGGGAGLAYVFIHLLPELASGGHMISDAMGMHRYLPSAMTESLLFLVSLLGVVIPYTLAVISQQHPDQTRWTGPARLVTFALINYLYAYSLPSLLTTGLSYGLLFTVAISAHVLLADRTLAQDHPLAFRRRFRWTGSSALILGSIHAAALHPVSDLTLAVATAFVGGGLLISVFREEIPDVKRSRLSWFSLGLFAMTALLLLATARHGHA
ncbi:MAG: hypothetical protein CL862_07810 [Cyanobium sp. NAT70]|nr:hypothetical protein [Cyanobium sp. NAT70]|tara:strand:+ start:123 stop:863 length:741 start_codon:yes stop_codon:yes gene_type:complete